MAAHAREQCGKREDAQDLHGVPEIRLRQPRRERAHQPRRRDQQQQRDRRKYASEAARQLAKSASRSAPAHAVSMGTNANTMLLMSIELKVSRGPIATASESAWLCVPSRYAVNATRSTPSALPVATPSHQRKSAAHQRVLHRAGEERVPRSVPAMENWCS